MDGQAFNIYHPTFNIHPPCRLPFAVYSLLNAAMGFALEIINFQKRNSKFDSNNLILILR